MALQGDFREHLAALRACEVEGVAVRTAEALEGVAGLIMPGGESTAMARLMDPALREAIRSRVSAGLPVLGTCAGMILMARSIVDGRPGQEPLGLMDLTVRRNAFGRQVDSFEADLEVTALGREPFHAVFIRAADRARRSRRRRAREDR
jgi:5'-phosphate synthase pdxT subunit